MRTSSIFCSISRTKKTFMHTGRGYLSTLISFRLSRRNGPPLWFTNAPAIRRPSAQAEAEKSSIARKLAALRAFFKYLNRQGILSNNPARLIATPRQEKRLPSVLTADDAQRLMDAPAAKSSQHRPAELRDRAVLETLYSTGIRASELVGMNHDDINHHDRLIRIRGKGRKERIVPRGHCACSDRCLY
jgi:integrase/recombinase XerC